MATGVTVVGNGNLRPWVKGQSGNPGGRLSLLQRYVRGETKQGKDLIDFLIQVKNGEVTTTVVTKDGTVDVGPSIHDRLEATSMLLNRGWGKVKDAEVEVGEDGFEDLVERVKALIDRRGLMLVPKPVEAQCVMPAEP